MSFVPLALAGANGVVDGIDCRRLVASGVSLLQRTAPLVRALHGRRSAILLPAGPQLIVALAASSGRAALLLDPKLDPEALAAALRTANVGAVFTLQPLADRLPGDIPRLLLDDSPTHATWSSAGENRRIDLSLHAGLMLEGDPETDGADEEALLLPERGTTAGVATHPFTHRQLLAAARAIERTQRLDAREHALTLVHACSEAALQLGLIAPLLAGGRVTTGRGDDATSALTCVERELITTLVAARATYAALADALAARSRALDAPVLQRCIAVDDAGDDAVDAALADRWRSVSALSLSWVPRRDDFGAPEPQSSTGGNA